MNSIKSRRTFWIVTWLLFVFTSIYIFSLGPTLGGDSYGYLRMDSLRPLGYPLFLYIFRIFGDYQLLAVMIVQILLNIAAVFFFLEKIKKLFNLQLIHTLFLLPFFLFGLVFYSRPDAILTEAVSFPLFLIISVYVIEGILNKKLRSLYTAILLNTVLYVVREQFIFMFPLIAFISFYVILLNGYDNQQIIKKTSMVVAAILLCLVSASLLNKTYHYIYHGTFSNPHMNVSFFPTAIYISSPEDVQLFEDPAVKQSYLKIYELIEQEGLTMNHFYQHLYPEISPENRRRSDLIDHYHEHFETIQNITRAYYIEEGALHSEQVQNIIARDQQIKTMTIELIKNKPWMFLYINLSDILVYGFNNNRAYILLFILLTLISLWSMLKKNQYGTILFFFLSGHALNLFASSLSIKIIPRYTFYLTFMISTILVIILIKFLHDDKVAGNVLSHK